MEKERKRLQFLAGILKESEGDSMRKMIVLVGPPSVGKSIL
jgi:DNA replication protein DnaC